MAIAGSRNQRHGGIKTKRCACGKLLATREDVRWGKCLECMPSWLRQQEDYEVKVGAFCG